MLTPTIRRRGAGLTTAALAAGAVLLASPAQAAGSRCSFDGRPTPAGITCTTDYSSGSKVTVIRTGTGKTLRAAFYDGRFRPRGDRIEVYGSGSCSASTTDTDFRLSSLPDGWNDKISSAEDFAACDVNLFEHVGWGGKSTGYVNYAGWKGLPWLRHDWASSFRLS